MLDQALQGCGTPYGVPVGFPVGIPYGVPVAIPIPVAVPVPYPVPIGVPYGIPVPSYGYDNQACPTGYLPPPSCELGGAPRGRGLTKNADGSITTAGGYSIQMEGKDEAWKVIGPDGKQLTRVWGDPHVNEADGDKWDFKDSSTFTLPDGTRIFARTTPSEKNKDKTFTSSLDIANGSDRVMISGIDKNTPLTGPVTGDGAAWRAEHGLASGYELRHDGTNQEWVRKTNSAEWDQAVRAEPQNGNNWADAMAMLRELLFGSRQQQREQLLAGLYSQPLKM